MILVLCTATNVWVVFDPGQWLHSLFELYWLSMEWKLILLAMVAVNSVLVYGVEWLLVWHFLQAPGKEAS